MAHSDVVLRRRSILLVTVALCLSFVALGLIFFAPDYREAGEILLWHRGIDLTWLQNDPSSFVALLIVPIVVTAWVAILIGRDLPAVRKVALLAGAALVGLTALQESQDSYNDIANQIYFGLVPAALLCFASFGAAAALAQAANRSNM